MNRGRLCTLAAALLHDVSQAGAVEGLEELVHPQALVIARVEARLGLKLAAAALLCIELRARLGEQLLRLRREIKREMTVRSREIISAAREKTREIARRMRGWDHTWRWRSYGRASSESTAMAAQSMFEAQSFPDHASAPSSTTTSLATPSAMSTACDGGREPQRCSDRHYGNRSRRLVGHRRLEEHRSRRELRRRGHSVQALHRRDVTVARDLRAIAEARRVIRAATRAGLHTAWRDVLARAA